MGKRVLAGENAKGNPAGALCAVRLGRAMGSEPLSDPMPKQLARSALSDCSALPALVRVTIAFGHFVLVGGKGSQDFALFLVRHFEVVEGIGKFARDGIKLFG